MATADWLLLALGGVVILIDIGLLPAIRRADAPRATRLFPSSPEHSTG